VAWRQCVAARYQANPVSRRRSTKCGGKGHVIVTGVELGKPGAPLKIRPCKLCHGKGWIYVKGHH